MSTTNPTLLGLPVELRTKIFALVLTSEEARFKIDTIIFPTEERKAVIHNHHRNPKHRGQVYSRNSKTWVPAPPYTALLLTNKQILLEARPILYGSNKFVFLRMDAAVLFFTTIGEAKHSVRHIAFKTNFDIALSRPLWLALNGCTGLRSLTLHHFSVCQTKTDWKKQKDIASLKQLERLARPLLKGLQASFQAQGLVGSAAGVLRFVYEAWSDLERESCDRSEGCPCHVRSYGSGLRCGCMCSEVDGVDEGLMREFGEVVMEGLEKRA